MVVVAAATAALLLRLLDIAVPLLLDDPLRRSLFPTDRCRSGCCLPFLTAVLALAYARDLPSCEAVGAGGGGGGRPLSSSFIQAGPCAGSSVADSLEATAAFDSGRPLLLLLLLPLLIPLVASFGEWGDGEEGIA